MTRHRSLRRRLLRIQHGCSMFGNLCFFAGSLLFLFDELQPVGVLLFIAGSLGMLLGGVLPTLVRLWVSARETVAGEEDCTGASPMTGPDGRSAGTGLALPRAVR